MKMILERKVGGVVGETRAAVEEWYQVRAIESRAN